MRKGGGGTFKERKKVPITVISLIPKTTLTSPSTDYKTLSQMPDLHPPDKKIVTKALATLPPRINAAKETEMGEMMGKLKELGNGILKPFGLSTDMFNMVKDEKTGGYSMSMNSEK